MYKNRIAHLEELHRILDKDITTFEKENPYHNETAIKEKKKQKLHLKDEIARLQKLQWEHDHEHVQFDDEDR